MVVESIISEYYARKNPVFIFILGIIYSSLGILFSLIVFPNNASVSSIFITTIGCIPLFYNLLKSEEKLEIKLNDFYSGAYTSINVLGIFFFLFLGFTVGYSLWFSFLPEWALNSVFNDQLLTLVSIGNITGSVVNQSFFSAILVNNLKVLFFCFFFSFVYGTGAIFVLSWNASVLGAAVGSVIRAELESVAGSAQLVNLAVYFQHLPLSLGGYMLHGTFEIIAYFLAGLAGSLISFVLSSSDYRRTRNLFKVLKRSVLLVALAILLIFFAAFIEAGF